MTAAPVCYRHPDRHTLLSCSRCGKHICSSCSIDAAVGQRCPDCVKEEGVQRVVPTRARSRARSRSAGAPATTIFLIAAVAVFLFGPDEWVPYLAQSNVELAAGQWWRIFTVVLLHASFSHVLFNMWALWALGPQVERGVGTGPFVGLYIASAGVGGAFAYHLGGPFDIGVGASGAIFGIFGVWLSWAFHRRGTAMGRAMLGQLGFLLLINAALPILIPNISWQAHLGGLLAGLLIGEAWNRIQGANAVQMRTAVTVTVAVAAVVSVLI